MNQNWKQKDIVSVEVAACALYQSRYIYLFALKSYTVLKYDITENEISRIQNTTNLCFADKGKGLLHRNGKIYLHGCALMPWITLIFNPETEQFEDDHIEFDGGTPSEISWFRHGNILTFDDNVLLVRVERNSRYPSFPTLSKFRDGPDMYMDYAITDLISINFQDTELSSNAIWPSKGFNLIYFVNDFVNVSITYNLWIISESLSKNINANLTLNVVQDECNNRGNLRYKYSGCQQHFDLDPYLSPSDENIYNIEFRIEPHAII